MPRTNEVEVREVLDGTRLSSAQIRGAIRDANAWLSDELAGVGEARKGLVEKYLAAHFCTVTEPRIVSAKLSDVSEKYQVSDDVSEYLRMAASLDPTGAVQRAFILVEDSTPIVFDVATTFQDERAGRWR